MGAYLLIVNPTKRQYLDPARFGEAGKFSGVLRGDHCLLALKLLITDCFRRDKVAFRGAWLGDPVLLASDDEGQPDPGGLITTTTTEPHRNLHGWASAEFTNISYRALAELCQDSDVAEDLAVKAKEDRSLLIDLVAVLEQYHPAALEPALDRAVGRPWRKEYNKALVDLPYWRPVPPIDWTL